MEKQEKYWTIMSNGRADQMSLNDPITAMERAKQSYEWEMKKHREFCDLLRKHHALAHELEVIEDDLLAMKRQGFDLWPDTRVVVQFEDESEEVIWREGEIVDPPEKVEDDDGSIYVRL